MNKESINNCTKLLGMVWNSRLVHIDCTLVLNSVIYAVCSYSMFCRIVGNIQLRILKTLRNVIPHSFITSSGNNCEV